MGQLVTLHDKQFKPYISSEQIAIAVNQVAAQIRKDFPDQSPFFLVVLNGAFMFACDLIRAFNAQCDMAFVKASSYRGTQSTGNVELQPGLNADVFAKPVIIVEDIVETGNTIDCLVSELQKAGASSIKIASLLFKKELYNKAHPIDYYGIAIGNDFVVGYGLDYKGLGRHHKEIYVLA